MNAAVLRGIAGRRQVTIGTVRVSSYVMMLYVGCVVGVYAGAAVATADGLSATRFTLSAIVLLVPALAGSRLWYVLRNLEHYRVASHLVWHRAGGGAALYGGLVLSLAISPAVTAVGGLPFLRFWDAAAVTMLLGLVPTRIGCLMHGCCSGRPTRGALGVRLPDEHGVWARRYPTPLLEAGWALVVLGAVIATRPDAPPAGTLLAEVVGAYAAGRLVLERTRGSDKAPRSLLVNSAISVSLLAAAVALWVATAI